MPSNHNGDDNLLGSTDVNTDVNTNTILIVCPRCQNADEASLDIWRPQGDVGWSRATVFCQLCRTIFDPNTQGHA